MSVESILRARGENAGRYAEQRGAILGSTIAGLAQVPGQILADRDAERAARARAVLDAEDRRAKQEDRERQTKRYATEDAAAASAVARQEAVKRVFLAATNDATDVSAWNAEAAAAVAREAGDITILRDAQKLHRDIQAEPEKLTPNVDTTKDVINSKGEVVRPGVPEAPKPDKVTYGQPITAMVGGKRTLVRTGSDGKTYDLTGNVVDGASVAPEPKEPKAEKDERLVQIQGPNGTPIWVRESEAVGKNAAQAPRGVTGAERGVLAFYNRGKEAVEVLTDGGENSLEQKMAKQGLVKGAQLGYEGIGANYLKSEDQQRYRQAQRSFTEARLRKESGAAIPDSEFENDRKTYFVQPGDSEAVVKQKADLRQGVLDGLKFAAGRAFEEYYGEPNVSPARGGKDTADPLGLFPAKKP